MIGQLKLKNALMFASSLAANENEKKSADLMIQKIGIQAHKRGGLSEMQALFEKAAGSNQMYRRYLERAWNGVGHWIY
jgi:hypothetical protein